MIVSLPSLLLLFGDDILLALLLLPLDGADDDCCFIMVAEVFVEIGGRTALRSISNVQRDLSSA